LPTTALPKFTLEGFAVNEPSAAPSPLSGIASVGFDPSEVMVTFPAALPVTVGANLTLKLTLCPTLNVTGNANPLMLNPLPEALAAVILRLVPPELVSVSVVV